MPEISSDQGCLLLYMYNTGEPSHEEATTHHASTQTQLYHDVDSYMDLSWAMGNVAKPSVATGCMIKLLNYNPNSFAMTFLYCMTPNFYQDNISYHDCAEESYHLWGTSWMMQFGDVPTGGISGARPILTTVPLHQSMAVLRWAVWILNYSITFTIILGRPPSKMRTAQKRDCSPETHCSTIGPLVRTITIHTAPKTSS
jgi:hypothetical protein